MSRPSAANRPPNAPGHRAGGHRAGAGRKPALNTGQRCRFLHWCAWWPSRAELRPSATELARRMDEAARTVRDYAAGNRTPGPVALANLERLSAAYGYEPLTNDFQFP